MADPYGLGPEAPCPTCANWRQVAVGLTAPICLFTAGFFELSFSSMAQTVVQIGAPANIRGRVLGVFAMASLGCRAFAGVTVGLIGTLWGVHVSLALAAGMLFAVVSTLLFTNRKDPAIA